MSLFSWRARRQLVVVSIFIIVIGGGVLYIVSPYFFSASCFDGKRNQGEIAADCGGPCGPCELKNPKELTIFWARGVPVREGVYDVVAHIENPNLELSSQNLTYEFILLENGIPIARRRGTTFLLPQERLSIAEFNLTTERVPTDTEFQILDVEWEVRRESRPNIIVERRIYRVITDGAQRKSSIEARIQNRSPFDFREVEVNFIALDPDGNLLGVSSVVVEDLRAGESRDLKALWPTEFFGEIGSIQVEPRVNMLDPAVILKPR